MSSQPVTAMSTKSSPSMSSQIRQPAKAARSPTTQSSQILSCHDANQSPSQEQPRSVPAIPLPGIPNPNGGKGKVLIVGGANPNGSFSESHVINLVPCLSLLPYQTVTSGTFLSEGVWWHGMNTAALSLRAVHRACGCLLGHSRGRHPPARHGHVVAAVCSKLYIHGGMAGEKFHSNMYSLDTSSMKWEKVKAKAVALGKNIYIFGGVTSEGDSNAMYRLQCDEAKNIYFGMWSYFEVIIATNVKSLIHVSNIEIIHYLKQYCFVILMHLEYFVKLFPSCADKRHWTLRRFEGDLTPNRLDHSFCVLPWRVRPEGSSGEGDQAQSSSASETLQLAFVFGGMDTQRVIHSDCVVTVLT
ncbi:unnamed protein product, partial [Coregonus sp. 'balchen']